MDQAANFFSTMGFLKPNPPQNMPNAMDEISENLCQQKEVSEQLDDEFQIIPPRTQAMPNHVHDAQNEMGNSDIEEEVKEAERQIAMENLKPFDIQTFFKFIEDQINNTDWQGKDEQGKSPNFKHFLRDCEKQVKGTRAEPVAN